MLSQKGFSPIIVVLGAVLALLIGGGSLYYFGFYKKTSEPSQVVINNLPTEAITSPVPPINTQTGEKTEVNGGNSSFTSQDQTKYTSPPTYTDIQYGISFQYPEGIVKENSLERGHVFGVNTLNLKLLKSVNIYNLRDSLNSDQGKIGYDLTYEVYDNPNNIPADKFQKNSDQTGAKASTFTKDEVYIDGITGISGIWQSGDKDKMKDAFFTNNGYLYIFEITGDIGSTTGESILGEVLSTTRFTK